MQISPTNDLNSYSFPQHIAPNSSSNTIPYNLSKYEDLDCKLLHDLKDHEDMIPDICYQIHPICYHHP